jgi:hypothetical protein
MPYNKLYKYCNNEQAFEKVDVLPSCKQMFLLINSQRVSAQIGHHQIIPEE